MNDIETENKFLKALQQLNAASEQLSLAWELVRKAGSFKSPENLFHEFKDNILYLGDFKELFLFIRETDVFIHCGKEEKKYKSIENIEADLLNKYNQENMQMQEIRVGDDLFGILVAITKNPPQMLTYNSLGLLNLFLHFIRLKVVETRERNLREYRKAYRDVIFEKSILLHEHLILQELWTGKLSSLIKQISNIQMKNEGVFQDCQIKEILEDLNDGVEPLKNINRSTRDIIKSFGFYEAQTPVFLEKEIKSLFREIQIYFSTESMNQKFLKKTVFVDPEQVNEGIKQVVYVLNSFLGYSKIPPENLLEVLPYSNNGNLIKFGIGSQKIEAWWLTALDKRKRHWEESGPVITGLTFQSLDLAVKLIKKSRGNLKISKEKNGLPGFKIELPRFIKEKHD